jgi:hypothetical protein
MKLLIFVSCLLAVNAAMYPIIVKVYRSGDILPVMKLGPAGDIFNVRGFNWDCPNAQSASLPTIADLNAATYPPQGLQLNSLLECLKFFPVSKCVPVNSSAPVPLTVNLIEGSNRQVFTDNMAPVPVSPSIMNFFVPQLCPGFLALPFQGIGVIGSPISLDARIITPFDATAVTVTLLNPKLGSFMVDGVIFSDADIIFRGDAVTINGMLQRLQFLPSFNGTQVVKFTFETPSGALSGFVDILISDGSNSVGTQPSPSPSPGAVNGTDVDIVDQSVIDFLCRDVEDVSEDAPGRIGTSVEMVMQGTVADFNEATTKKFLSETSGAHESDIEIVSVQSASVLLTWRLDNLSPGSEAKAKASLLRHCQTVLARFFGVDCASIRDVKPKEKSGNNVTAGGIVGIVLGIVGGIGLCVAIALLVAACSKKGAGPPSQTLYGEEFYGVANPGLAVYAPPPTPDIKYIP